MSISIRRSPATSKHIAEMLRKVSGFIDSVALVTISKKSATFMYADTGLTIDVDQSTDKTPPEELVAELLRVCREHAVEHGDGWYQATFATEEKEIKGKGKGAPSTFARATLDVIAFPIGDTEDATTTRSAAKAAVESEAALAIRSQTAFVDSTLTKLGEQVVNLAGAVVSMAQATADQAKQVSAQQKGYVTQGETLVELVKMQHAHQLAMAEAESSEKHAEQVIDFATKFGMEWAKAHLFNKPGKPKNGKEAFKPDPAKCDSANIIGNVLHDLDDKQREDLVALIGDDVLALWVAASGTTTQDECAAILLKMRDLWGSKSPEEMSKISQGLALILGMESAMKLYAVLKECDVAG